MLSSCKNTAWERSKCLRHPQPPALGCPARSWGPSGDPRLDQDPLLPRGRGGCGRRGVRGAWGWKSVARFGCFPFGFLF